MPTPPPFPPDYPPLPEEEMDLSSGEESEYESGDDGDKERCGAGGWAPASRHLGAVRLTALPGARVAARSRP